MGSQCSIDRVRAHDRNLTEIMSHTAAYIISEFCATRHPNGNGCNSGCLEKPLANMPLKRSVTWSQSLGEWKDQMVTKCALTGAVFSRTNSASSNISEMEIRK